MHIKALLSIFIYSLLFCSSLLASFAQQQDQLTLYELKQRGFDYRNSLRDSSLFYANELHKRTTNESQLNANAKLLSGYYFYKEAVYDTSYQLLMEAYEILESPFEKALSANTIGRIFSKHRNFKSAEKYLLASLELYELSDSLKYQFYTLNDLGILKYDQGDYTGALKYYADAKVCALKANLEHRLVGLMSNIVGVYTMLNEYDKALEIAHEAYKLSLTSNLSDQQIALSALGYAHQKLNHLDSAIAYNEKSLQLSKAGNDRELSASQFFDAGDLYLLKKDYQAALKSYKTAVALLENSQSQSLIEQIVLQIAIVYQTLNIPDSTIHYARRAHDKALQSNLKWELMKSSLLLSETYVRTGQYAKAAPYFQLALQYKDSIYNNQTQQQFTDERVKIETLEKIKEIDALKSMAEIEQLKKRSFMQLSFAVTAVLVLTIIFIIIGYRNSRKIDQLKAQKLQRTIEQSQKDLHVQTLHMIRMNNNIQEVEDKLVEIKPKTNGLNHEVQGLISSIKINKSLEKEWENFNTIFTKTHAGFIDYIKAKYPSLSMSEIRLCALLLLHLSNAEMGAILNIVPKSVAMSKYRIKKKMDIPKEADLLDHLNELKKNLGIQS